MPGALRFLAVLAVSLATGGCNPILDIPPAEESAERDPDAGTSECAHSRDCLTDGADASQRICRGGQCVPLFLDPYCPVALPDRGKLWREQLAADGPEPLVLGVFSSVRTAALFGSDALNYDLGLAELAGATGGLPLGDGRTRPVLALVCDNQFTDEDGDQLDRVVDHLVDGIQVPGIVGALSTESFRRAFQRSLPNHVFYLNVYDAAPELQAIEDHGLMWHMLPEWGAMVPTYVALLDRTVGHLVMSGKLSPGEPVKVALVTSMYASQFIDVAERLRKELRFNGETAEANSAEHFRQFEIGRAGELLEAAEIPGLAAQLVADLSGFAPHVIVSTMGAELLTHVIPALEGGSPELEPFYLLSPAQFQPFYLVPALNSRQGLWQRLAGVNFAAAADPTLYEQYQGRFDAYHSGRAGESRNQENYYDGIYYLLYAAAAAPASWPLRGSDLAVGVRRLLAGADYDVGPADFSAAFAELFDLGNTITLNATMGPPDFDSKTGARATPGTVWCVDSDLFVQADVLRLNDAGDLIGSFPCFEFGPP